jgi:hypothetical protein
MEKRPTIPAQQAAEELVVLAASAQPQGRPRSTLLCLGPTLPRDFLSFLGVERKGIQHSESKSEPFRRENRFKIK